MSILLILIFILIFITLLHYHKYIKNTDLYQIDQQELEFVKGNELYDNLNPLVITFIEDNTLKFNIENYKLYSDISIDFKYFMINTDEKYLSHNNEILLIKPKKEIIVELINNSYHQYFKNNNKNKNLNYYILPSKYYSDVKSIEIKIHEYNILYIPRFWYFKFLSIDNNVEIFTCNNIFTKLFNSV